MSYLDLCKLSNKKLKKSEQKGISDKQRQYYLLLEGLEHNGEKFDNAKIQKLIDIGHTSLTRIEPYLYIRITPAGTPLWVYQYKIHKNTKRITLGRFGHGPDCMLLAKARNEMTKQRASVIDGKDPVAERNRASKSQFKTVDDLALDWLDDLIERLEHPQIPRRIYNQEIKPCIGGISIDDVTGLDIREVLKFVKTRKKTQRPTIANDTLTYLKQLFDHGMTLGLIHYNPASPFKTKHAGGTEKSRDRALSMQELIIVFRVMQENSFHFVRENLLAVVLIIILGVRKGELIGLPWTELDFENNLWRLPEERAKNDHAIDIPLPHQVVTWLKELKVRAGNSEYVFPSRRKNRNSTRDYISDDTLNAALTNLFGIDTKRRKSTTGNVLGEAGIDYFVIHDLRRTTRTLMSKNKVRYEVAEKAINHVKKGVEGIYNRDAFLEERTVAHQQLADQIAPLINA